MSDRLRDNDEAAMAPGERAAYANGWSAAGAEIDALRTKVEQLSTALSWIEDQDPQLVDAARDRFEFPPLYGPQPAPRRDGG